MSRSYKKTPICKDSGMNRMGKKYANRRWRRTSIEDNFDEKSLYKRNYPQYDIHDYISRWTKEDAIARYKTLEKERWFKNSYPTLDIYLEEVWYKYFRRK